MKVALVYSGATSEPSPDDQDTLVQMQEVNSLLSLQGIEVQPVAFEDSFSDLETKISLIKPDFIFNLVETVKGTDSLSYIAAAFFEYMNIPYTGCSAMALALLSSKIRQKELLFFAGLPTPDFISESHNKLPESGPWIVKSDTEHASVGIDSGSVVKTSVDAIKKILEKQNDLGSKWFAECYIDGREFNLSLLGDLDGRPLVLPAAEILFVDYPEGTPKIVDYATKWETESFGYQATFRRFDFDEDDRALLAQLEDLCRQCWDLFGLKGAARIDFRVDVFGNPWILEVNANPCLSSDAGFMAAAQKKEISIQNVIKRLFPVQH
jgi:D-alanine-D-alanine ligase